MTAHPELTARQRELLTRWLPSHETDAGRAQGHRMIAEALDDR